MRTEGMGLSMKRDLQLLPAELKTLGLRATPARVRLLEQLRQRQDHPTAEQLAETLRAQGERFGLATLYQNLNRLAEAGAIRRLKGGDGLIHFDANTTPHHHLTCLCCGRIADTEIESLLPAMLLPRCPHTGAALTDWQLQGVQLELKGLCPDCRGN